MNESSSAADAGPRKLSQALRSWRAAGVTHLPRTAAAVDLPQASLPIAAPPSATEIASTSSRPIDRQPVIQPESRPSQRAPSTCSLGERRSHLASLAEQVAACTRCQELAATRTRTVFGVGDPQARVLFVGEAPGADEDQQGEPFVGKAGQLLNRIITACGWRREEIYICNILRCRPPNNRTPSDEEAANCREYLEGQIAIVDPEYIVCWGAVAAKNLLQTEESIGKLRERWFQYGRARVLCTYHPSYLLRNPSAKRFVWDDMQRLLKEMGLAPPAAAKS